jgi:hypothetical protein
MSTSICPGIGGEDLAHPASVQAYAGTAISDMLARMVNGHAAT